MTDPLQQVQHLFFGFFQFIFHHHHAFLYIGIVSFTSGGIDFPTDLLQNEG